MGFLNKLHAKFELYKLEQRYARRKRRTTFTSDATYIDGEYVYNPPSPQRLGFRASTFGSGSTKTR